MVGFDDGLVGIAGLDGLELPMGTMQGAAATTALAVARLLFMLRLMIRDPIGDKLKIMVRIVF